MRGGGRGWAPRGGPPRFQSKKWVKPSSADAAKNESSQAEANPTNTDNGETSVSTAGKAPTQSVDGAANLSQCEVSQCALLNPSCDVCTTRTRAW